MLKSKLTHNDAQFSLLGTILRKLVYPLVTTTLTPKQCTTKMQPIYRMDYQRLAWSTL